MIEWLIIWFLSSIPFGMLMGRFIEVGERE